MNSIRRRGKAPKKVICPKCGNVARVVDSPFGPKHVCCGLWSYHGRPLVDAATHRARIRAHDAFDPLWQSGTMSRAEAYRRLRKALQMRPELCHMADMTIEDLNRVPAAVSLIWVGMEDQL